MCALRPLARSLHVACAWRDGLVVHGGLGEGGSARSARGASGGYLVMAYMVMAYIAVAY